MEITGQAVQWLVLSFLTLDFNAGTGLAWDSPDLGDIMLCAMLCGNWLCSACCNTYPMVKAYASHHWEVNMDSEPAFGPWSISSCRSGQMSTMICSNFQPNCGLSAADLCLFVRHWEACHTYLASLAGIAIVMPWYCRAHETQWKNGPWFDIDMSSKGRTLRCSRTSRRWDVDALLSKISCCIWLSLVTNSLFKAVTSALKFSGRLLIQGDSASKLPPVFSIMLTCTLVILVLTWKQQWRDHMSSHFSECWHQLEPEYSSSKDFKMNSHDSKGFTTA